MKPFLTLILGFLPVSGVLAVNTIEQPFVCPLDGQQWKQRMETSQHPTGLRLDLKELGDVVQPPTVPVCPKCRLVLFAETFDAPLLQRLKPFVFGADYRLLAAKSPPYACLAQIQEFLGAPPLYLGYSYLRASWEVEAKEAQCQRYLARSQACFTQALAAMKPGDPERLKIALLCGELERRLQKWEAAMMRFRELHDAGAGKEPHVKQVLALQMKLIVMRDSRPRALSGLSDGSKEALPTRAAVVTTDKETYDPLRADAPPPLELRFEPTPETELQPLPELPPEPSPVAGPKKSGVKPAIKSSSPRPKRKTKA